MKMGKFNVVTPISGDDFFQQMALWGYHHSSTVLDEETEDCKQDHCRIFKLHENSREGIGFVFQTEKSRYTVPKEFFRFGDCDHTYGDEVIGRCLTRYTCTKCGHSYTLDATD